MKNKRLIMLVEIAIFAALSLILDLFIPSIGPMKITFKMVPIIILDLRWGVGAGLVGGLLWGLLQIAVGEAKDSVHIVQMLVDYPVAFAAAGMSGLMARPLQLELRKQDRQPTKVLIFAVIGALLSNLCRYLFHFITGYIFFGQYAPEGQHPAVYSFLYNGTGFLSETIVSIIVIAMLVPMARAIFLNRNLMMAQRR